MGSSVSIEYAVPVSDKKEGETPVYRNPKYVKGLVEFPSAQLKTIKDIVLASCKQNAGRNCLGTIVRQGEKENLKEKINYITYEQLLLTATNLGSGIIHEKLDFQNQGESLRFIGVFSRNRYEWHLVDIACVLYNLTTVPIYDTLGDENISYVLNHTNLTTIFVNDISLRALMKTQNMGNVKHIVCFDPFSENQASFFTEKGISLSKLSDLIKCGSTNPVDHSEDKYTPKQDTCITFSYTSGTTGPPKGAMLSHRNFVSFISILNCLDEVRMNNKDVSLSYLPLPHVLERELDYSMLFFGAQIVYFCGDTNKIKDDLALVKPTVFVSVPRLFSRFSQVINKKFDDLQGYTKTALQYSLKSKLTNVSTSGSYTHSVYDKVFFSKTKAALGGNVRYMISGSAPLLPDVHKMMKVTMCAPLYQAYGQTESTGGVFITHALDPEVGHIGGPVSNIEYKLVDIPEMKYTSGDKDEEGRPMPRGEIWMRGPAVFLGYYRNQEKTRETLTEDGWLKSGDVGAILPKTKALKLIDRKKNIFKLQQGEYVASEKVENVYAKCTNLAEVFLHGESTESFAIAVVVPQKQYLQDKAKELNIEGNDETLCADIRIRSALLQQMNAVAKKEGLKSFEMAKNVYLEPQSFVQRQLVTTTMKIQRHEAKLFYADKIKDLYQEGMLK